MKFKGIDHHEEAMKRIYAHHSVPQLPEEIDGVRYFNKASDRDAYEASKVYVPIAERRKLFAESSVPPKKATPGMIKPLNYTKAERKARKMLLRFPGGDPISKEDAKRLDGPGLMGGKIYDPLWHFGKRPKQHA